MAHYPSGSSFKGFEHFGQMMLEGKFQRYDYGKELNIEKYGVRNPPEIDLKKIQGMKIAQFVGTVDKLATPEDNHWLKEQLGTNSIYYKEFKFGHMAFMLAQDMSYFNDVLELIKTYR